MTQPLWITLAKGPVFYFTLSIVLLGLGRLVLLSIWGMIDALRRANDRRLQPSQLFKETVGWLFPVRRLHTTRPIYSFASFFFHVGIIFSALFLQNHIDILRSTVHLGWIALPKIIVNWLTLATVGITAYLLLHRIYLYSARALSKPMDYLLLLMLFNIFVSGYVAGQAWNPVPYNGLMLFHTLNGILFLLLIPFTKIAHCVLFPLVRAASEIAWHLAPQGGVDVVKTLTGAEERKI